MMFGMAAMQNVNLQLGVRRGCGYSSLFIRARAPRDSSATETNLHSATTHTHTRGETIQLVVSRYSGTEVPRSTIGHFELSRVDAAPGTTCHGVAAHPARRAYYSTPMSPITQSRQRRRLSSTDPTTNYAHRISISTVQYYRNTRKPS